MTNSTTAALRKALTMLKSRTALIVRDAEYDTGSTGWTRNTYQQERGWQKHKRGVGKLKRLLTKAKFCASLLGSDLAFVVSLITIETQNVLARCDHFPSDKEWPGQKLLTRQVELIEEARRLL